MMRKITTALHKIILFVFVSLVSASAAATQIINAVVIDGYPANAMWLREFTHFFIPEVDKRLAKTGNYRMQWQESYDGSIVKTKGVLGGIKKGLGDIGIVTTIFHTSKLPSQALAAVTPFTSADARVVAKAIDDIAIEFPTMQREFGKQNQIYLATGVVLDSYQIFSKKPLNSFADLQGSTVAGGGMNLRYLEGISGTAGVRGDLMEFYDLLYKGVVDHAMIWPEAANTFNIAEVAPYMLKADLGAVNSKAITVNAKYWEALPMEVKSTLKQVAADYRDHVAGIAMSLARESNKKFIAAGGKIAPMLPSQRQLWADSMPNIALEWAHKLDKSGEPGTAMLRAYLAKLAAAGELPARNWTVKTKK